MCVCVRDAVGSNPHTPFPPFTPPQIQPLWAGTAGTVPTYYVSYRASTGYDSGLRGGLAGEWG